MSELLSPILNSSSFQVVSMITGVLSLFFTCIFLFWVFRDAQKRGWHPALVTGFSATAAIVAAVSGSTLPTYGFAPTGLFTLVAVLVCYIFYLAVRPPEFLQDARERKLSILLLDVELENDACPHCHAGIEPDFLVCPACGKTLRTPCEHCGRPVKMKWKICPYCKAH
ncbi:MAG: zinc ribbon domain-containing protein [Coriobacteriia bacterium]|nr:zinc ribbon domain-containing protein [Coriobacteriia bacterium]